MKVDDVEDAVVEHYWHDAIDDDDDDDDDDDVAFNTTATRKQRLDAIAWL